MKRIWKPYHLKLVMRKQIYYKENRITTAEVDMI